MSTAMDTSVSKGQRVFVQLSSCKIYKQKYPVVQDMVAFVVNTTVYSSNNTWIKVYSCNYNNILEMRIPIMYKNSAIVFAPYFSSLDHYTSWQEYRVTFISLSLVCWSRVENGNREVGHWIVTILHTCEMYSTYSIP
jgi:hypothetical protein